MKQKMDLLKVQSGTLSYPSNALKQQKNGGEINKDSDHNGSTIPTLLDSTCFKNVSGGGEDESGSQLQASRIFKFS